MLELSLVCLLSYVSRTNKMICLRYCNGDFILCIGFIGLTKYENIEKSRRSNVSENKTKPSKEGMFINTYITLPKPCRYAFKDVYHCVLLPLRNRRFSYNRKKRLNAHFDIISSIVYRGS